MTFYNVNLPHNISSGSQASLVTIVDIARAPDGSESRRSRRSQPLMRYDIGQNVRRENDGFALFAEVDDDVPDLL